MSKHKRRNPLLPQLNQEIRYPIVRVIFEDGTQEVMPLQKALLTTKELGVDLLLIAKDANPPVCKAMEKGKFLYEKSKSTKSPTIKEKELTFSSNIGENDKQVKLNHAIDFLKKGHTVRLIVQFVGRDVPKAEQGKETLEHIIDALSTYGKSQSIQKSQARNRVRWVSTISPLKK